MPESTASAGLRWASAGATAILSLLCSATFWAMVPPAAGLRSDVVMSGSMSPRLKPGDVVVSVPVAMTDLHPGMVISFTDPASGKRNLIHRYIAPAADGELQTKGDANASADSTPVSPAHVHGMARVLVPYVGLPGYWARTGRMLPLIGATMAVLGLVFLATANPTKTGGAAGRGTAGRLRRIVAATTRRARLSRLRPARPRPSGVRPARPRAKGFAWGAGAVVARVRALASVLALAVVVAAVVSLGPGDAAFTATTTNPSTHFGAATNYLAGAVYGWGDNTTGNLGLGNTTSPQTSPVQMGAVTTWVQLDTGNAPAATGVDANTGHTCAVRADGTLWCWGKNAYGQFGRGNTTDSTTPAQIGAATDWSDVNAAFEHTCAVKTTGTLWCTGFNGNGQIGQGNTTQYTSFTQVGASTLWQQVSTSGSSSCATRTDGTAWCWGYGGNYRLGNNSTADQTTPSQVSGTNFDTISLGAFHGCAVKLDHTLWCWGNNTSGELGLGDNTTRQTPVQVGAATNWMTVNAIAQHTCAIKTDNSMYCWGLNSTYQVGNGNTTNQKNPVQITGTWMAVGGGADYTCATKTDRSVWCWGDNTEGSLGTGNTTTKTTPTQVSGVTGRVFGGGDGAGATLLIT